MLKNLVGGVTGCALSANKPARADKAKRLVFAGTGKDWTDAVRSAWLDPFSADTGTPVLVATDWGEERLRKMLAVGRVEWDVVEIPADFQWIGARDGLFEKLDFSIINRGQVMTGPDLVTETSIADVLWSHVMFCNSQQFAEGRQPQNWAGVWNINGYPGRRCFPAKANGGALEAALLADGVAPSQLYPLDIDRALKSLGQIKDHILWWNTDAQAEKIMVDGQAVLGLVADRTALAAIDQGAQISIQYNQSLLNWSCLVIPKGAPNRTAAMAFLNYVLAPEQQAAIAMADTFGPVTQSAFEQIPPHRAGMLSGGPQQQGRSLWVNAAWWAQNLKPVATKFDAWRNA